MLRFGHVSQNDFPCSLLVACAHTAQNASAELFTESHLSALFPHSICPSGSPVGQSMRSADGPPLGGGFDPRRRLFEAFFLHRSGAAGERERTGREDSFQKPTNSANTNVLVDACNWLTW